MILTIWINIGIRSLLWIRKGRDTVTKKEIYDVAYNRLLSRRQTAIAEAEEHYRIASSKIPEIISLKQKMAQSTINLTKLVLSKNTDLSQIAPQIMDENLIAQKKIKELLYLNHFPMDYLDVHYQCEKCNDSGYKNGKRCECLNNIMKQVAADELNRSTYLSLSQFSDFKLDYFQGNDREQMSQIFEFCKTYAKTFSVHSPNILMTGNTGLGKTHLSLSIANEVLKKGFTVLYGMSQDFFEKIQDEHFGKGEPGVHTMSSILDTDLLIMDDLGAEYDSNFNTATFYNIINTRLNAGKSTIINTNLTLQQLASRYGNRTGSRLMTLYKCLKFVGVDIRQQSLMK